MHFAILNIQLFFSESPLAIEIDNFVTFITTFAVVIGVIFFVLALIRGYNFFSSLTFLIGIITANVPEGLLPTLTVSMCLHCTFASFGNIIRNR